jgi:hypothetical protein
MQRTILHNYLRVKKDNPDISIKTLEEMIVQLESGMEQEDIALVKEKIARLYNEEVEK